MAQDGESFTTWQSELPSEVEFWKWWITEPNMPYDDERRERLNPDTPLQSWLCDLIGAPAGAVVRILDVGAGPATALGKVWPEHSVEVIATDPLADMYNGLLDEAHVNVPVRTQACDGERLDTFLAGQSFDLAYSRNALDHSYDPLRIIQNMTQLVKPGGWVILEHYVNEAENAKYTGLHQWNFREEEGKFVITGHDRRIVVEDHLPPVAEMTVDIIGGTVKPMIVVKIHK